MNSRVRAAVEWKILAKGIDQTTMQGLEEMLGSENPPIEIVKGDIRLQLGLNKKVGQVWVHWRGQSHLVFSGPEDRHYVIDRTRGMIFFGDGVRGKIPPAGAVILAKQFRSGGGAAGNVPERAVSQLLVPIPGVQKIFNPLPAEGGANSETLEAFSKRAPKTLRHRGRAIAAADYEALAYEASPAVAVARVIATSIQGSVNLLIIPFSQEAQPRPFFGLREQVLRFIEARAPVDLAETHQIKIIGPTYFKVNIAATLAPLDPAGASVVERRAREALEDFLHPLRGGPEKQGWELGRDVYLSDIAAVLGHVEGVDYVETLTLSASNGRSSEHVEVPEDQIVVAGNIQLTLKGSRG